MTKFSANLGFLWTELSLPDAIRAAKQAGFDAVECHYPFETPALDMVAALQETGLKMLGLNTMRGDVDGGENGLAALPGRQADARAAIDQAIDYEKTKGKAKTWFYRGMIYAQLDTVANEASAFEIAMESFNVRVSNWSVGMDKVEE